MSSQTYSILHLEDSALDAEFVRQRLARSELSVQIEHVTNRNDFIAKLQSGAYDLILSDYKVPTFQGLESLDLAKQHQPNTPFMFVSGTMGEELAVETLQRGATDYILKERLARLPSAVERALKEVRERAERQAAELVYRETQERLRFAHEAAMLGVWDLDLSSRELVGSSIFKANLGLTTEQQLFEKTLLSQVHVDDRESLKRAIDAAARNDGDLDSEFRVALPDGEVRWLNLRGRLIADQSGHAHRLSGISLDITARKRAEESLATSESKFRQLANAIPNLAWMGRSDGHIFWYNDRWFEYTGTTIEQMEGWGWQSVHDPQMLPHVMRNWKHSISTGTPFEMVFPIRGVDGTFRPFLTRVLPQRNESGEIQYWFGTNTDISAQKRAEEQLVRLATRESHRAYLLTQLSSAAQTVNAVQSTDSIIRIIADKARQVLGTDVAVVSVTSRDSQQPDMDAVSISDEFRAKQKQNGNARNISMTFNPKDRDGWLVSPLLGHAGRPLGEIRVSPIPERKFNEEDEAVLLQLASIAAVSIENSRLYESLREQDQRKDEFLATLAHELRNPLAPIRNGLSVLRMDPNADIHVLIEMMERQLKQMVHLVDDLLDVSRVTTGKINLKREELDLREIIQSAIETCRPLTESLGHQLEIVLPASPLPLTADWTRISQVLTNLLNNAAKYTPAGGQITLKAERSGDEAIVRISDSGIGIPPEMLGRVFDMFTQVGSTLDRSQGGLGIGLTLVRRLVEMHRGSVEAESPGLGQGSTFIVRLPISRKKRATGETDGDAGWESSIVKRRRILVVDDNRDAATTTAMMLKICGAEPKTAHDGLEAVEVAATFQPDVILMDIGMPALNGYQAARRIREQPWSEKTKIIALTGWGQESDRVQSKEAGCDGHLVKPIEIAQLVKILTELGS